MKAIAWAACFLKAPDAVYEAFDRLGRDLAARGIKLVLFGADANQESCEGFTYVHVPFRIADLGAGYDGEFVSEGFPVSSAALSELVEIDRVWGSTFDKAKAELFTLRGLAFWEQAFRLMQPSLIVSWGSHVPLSRLFFNIGRRFQRPVFILERGVLEDTFSYSVLGQGALSHYTTSLNLVAPSLEDPATAAMWAEIETYYGQALNRHYSAHNESLAAEQAASLGEDPGPRILYMGSADAGSGASFDHERLGDLQGTWVKSSEAAASELVEAVREVVPGASLWLKPHPFSPFAVEEQLQPSIVRNLSSIDIYQLVEACDVCVTLTSSTQFLAFLKGKPVITLGNGQFMGKGITYEARSAHELRQALDLVQSREDFPERLARGRALIAASFMTDHIAIKDGVPSKYKLCDLAAMLGAFASYAPAGLEDADRRVQSFLSWSNDALKRFARDSRNEKIRYEAKIADCNKRLTRRFEELASLTRMTQDLVTRHRHHVADLDRELASIRDLLAEERAKSDRLLALTATQQEEAQDLKRLLAERQQAAKQAEEDIEELKAAFDAKSGEAISLAALADDLKAQRDNLSQRNAVLEAEIEALHLRWHGMKKFEAEMGDEVERLAEAMSFKLFHAINRARRPKRTFSGLERKASDQTVDALFDSVWYAKTYSDFSATGLQAVDHYLRIAFFQGKTGFQEIAELEEVAKALKGER